MKNMLIATAVAAALSYLPAGANAAASPEDLAQIREQLQGLMQRVDKLEQENTALKTENQDLKTQSEDLKAQSDYLKAETRGLRKGTAADATAINNLKGAEWASRVTLNADMRYRYEYISDDTVTSVANGRAITAADRYRDRLRARFNVIGRPTDNITVGLGFATTEGGDPRSSNQSLTNVFSRKSLDLDLAYFDWKFVSGGNLIGGKMKQPFFKPGQSLFWDNDINPEGLALTFNTGMFFGSAYNYWLNEVSGSQTARTADITLYGGQFGVRLPIASSTLTLAAHYYDLSSGQGRSPFYVASSTAAVPVPSSAANGNTTVNLVTGTAPNTVTTAVLVNDYEVVNLSAQYEMPVGNLPLVFWADVAQNQDKVRNPNGLESDLDMAWAAGFTLGRASNYRTWEVGAFYQVLEKDAVFAQLIDSDFAGGVADSEGWVVKAGFAPMRNWALNATYFLTKRNVDRATSPVLPLFVSGQQEIDYDRLQLDFNVKF